MKKNLSSILMLSVIAAAFLAFGIYEFSNTLKLMRSGIRTTGTVVGLRTHYDRKQIQYMPRIEFQTETGRTVVYVYSVGSNPPAYFIGQKVPVVYLKENPGEFCVESKWVFLLPAALILVGVGLAVLCAGLVKKRKAPPFVQKAP